jgi:catechol 2,3-dioxygenase-like lactoylglutathione lyase family enzyme
MMLTHTFHHLALSVRDVAESVAFYQSVLGLEEIPNTASDSPTRWLSLGEGTQLHLIPYGIEDISVNKGLHLALRTQNMDAFVRHLAELNVEWMDWHNTPDRSYIRKDGIRQVYFQDPNGYYIEVNDAGT